MGRMIDMLRNADRRPTAEIARPGSEKVSGTFSAASPAEKVPDTFSAPALEDDDDVPFIEVGGPREPSLRLVPAAETVENKSQRIEDRTQLPETLPLPPVLRSLPSNDETLALFTIRFQPVHAARLGGRSPVAELIAFHQPDHPISVQYRSLAAEIARQLPGTLPRVLVFTGAAGNVGTSTVVLNLAITLARQDARITVADAHLARPALAGRMGLPDGPGLGEVLAGQMPPAWCLQETAHPNLLVLPSGNAGRPRDRADVTPLLELLRDRSDCVLVDAGPWGEAEIAADLASGSDAVYLVLSHEAAGTPTTIALQEEILEQTGRLRGCVLTQR